MSNVREFGAKGDGQSDDTDALQRAVNQGDGRLVLPRGRYVISRPITACLGEAGPISIAEGRGAQVVMGGAGPAFHLVGTHEGTASPDSLTPQVRDRERMPLVSDVEIVGAHPEADGLRLEGLWQPILSRVHVRECRHGVHVVRRNRNLIVTDCHIHNNRGVGIFYDHLNLHQSNICNSHISYNRGGGIKVLASEIRNLQITGNDIEYNYDSDAAESADVWVDTLAASVREGTIVGNTIQAVPSPGGANIRFRGRDASVRGKVGHWAISGNLISSQSCNIHLQFARGVVISGNSFFSGHEWTVRAEDCDSIVVGPNCIDRNPDYRVETGDGLLFDRCSGCSVSGVLLRGTRASGGDGAITARSSEDIAIANCQILDADGCGVLLDDCVRCRVSGCAIVDRRQPPLMQVPVRVDGGRLNTVDSNTTPIQGDA